MVYPSNTLKSAYVRTYHIGLTVTYEYVRVCNPAQLYMSFGQEGIHQVNSILSASLSAKQFIEDIPDEEIHS